MLTKEDIIYSGQQTDRVIMACALGIEGEVIITIATFLDVFELLLNSEAIVCAADDCGSVEVLKDGEVVETLAINDAFLGSVLASSPDIMELVRRNPDNSLPELTDELRIKMSVVPGWAYDQSGFIPPPGWVLPPPRTPEEIEAARQAMQELRGL